jgi:hypothetical protein
VSGPAEARTCVAAVGAAEGVCEGDGRSGNTGTHATTRAAVQTQIYFAAFTCRVINFHTVLLLAA